MADNRPHRALRRRARRRAEREVENIVRIQALRNELLNLRVKHDTSESESSSSGNVETDLEVEGERSFSDLSDNENAAPVEFNYDAGNNVDIFPEVHLGVGEVHGENVAVPDRNSEVDSQSEHEQNDDANQAAGEIELTDEEKEQFVIQAIREWASSGGVLSMRKVDELLGKLSFVFKNMPKSYKTLLSTASELGIEIRGDFKFWYKGFVTTLNQLKLDKYLEVNGSIKFDVNMDGLPLFKDSSKESIKKFWPILAKLVGSEEDRFIIGIYCGDCDPRDVDLYLADLVIEIDTLNNGGYIYNGVRYDVSIRNFVLDAPARSLIKCCVGHGGYGACEKCTVVGQHIQGRVCFANVGADCQARTDDSYSRRLDRLHHCGRSPLELVNVGMVSQFRLDTMHLLYKGAFSRYLDALLTWEGEWNLSEASLSDISAKLLSFIPSCPRDFNRKPRTLQKYYKYKATELRRLLLYDGVVAFRDNLDEDVYKLFLLLHSAVYILASPYLLPLFVDEAELFLSHFVQFSAEMFGDHFVVYNVHSLLHLAQECRENGTVESFSAYPYENCLKTIKQTLQSGNLPLEQIAKRDSERNQRRRKVKMAEEGNSVQLFQSHTDRNEREAGQQFLRICVNNVTLKVGGKDSWFMTSDGVVVKLLNVIQRGQDSILLVGKRFMDYDDVYTYPMPSSRLGIMKVCELSGNRETFPLEDIFCKCWVIEDGDAFISMPLVHSCPLLH